MRWFMIRPMMLVGVSLSVLAVGCGSQELTTSVGGVEVVGQPKPAVKTAPPPPAPVPAVPLPEEQVVIEPLPPPQPPSTPPLEVAKPAAPPEIVVVPPPAAPPQPREPAPFLLDIPFSFDQAKLRTDAVAMVEVNAMRLQETTGWHLLLEGHCDERGTTAYNLVLGERRVHAVKEYLARLGVPTSAIEVISYGKERPFCTEHNQECWQKNRIVHFELQ